MSPGSCLVGHLGSYQYDCHAATVLSLLIFPFHLQGLKASCPQTTDQGWHLLQPFSLRTCPGLQLCNYTCFQSPQPPFHEWEHNKPAGNLRPHLFWSVFLLCRAWGYSLFVFLCPAIILQDTKYVRCCGNAQVWAVTGEKKAEKSGQVHMLGFYVWLSIVCSRIRYPFSVFAHLFLLGS